MQAIPTPLQGCYVIEPTIFKDNRGYFMESFQQEKFQEITKSDTVFIQDNQSFSSYGTIRGLHLQTGVHAQAKLVRVLQGVVLDVVVDLREDSATYAKSFSIVLSQENKKQLFVPRGFAHGFAVLSPTATFFYKCDNYYHKPAEAGVCYNDPDLAIDWQLPKNAYILSEKDKALPFLKQYQSIKPSSCNNKKY